MAKLIESIALSGSRKADGTANASGLVWIYVLGTNTQATAYSDRDGEAALTQPVILDAAGKATVYVDQAVTVHVETSTGASLQDTDLQDAPGAIAVENAGFTGTLASGSQGAGGVTDLDTVLTSALTSFGGTDFRYTPSAGGTQRAVSAWMSEVWISVKSFGALGDGLHDDKAAIQGAVNYVISLGGGTVYFPPGFYLTAFIENDTTIPVNFVGAGPNSSIIKNSVTNAYLLGFNNSALSGFEIRDLGISSISNTNASAITIVGVTRFALRNVVVQGHTQMANISGTTSQLDFDRCIWLSGSGGSPVGISISGVFGQMTISRCRFLGGDIGINLANGTVTGVAMWGNYFTSVTAINVFPTSSTPPIVAFGNQISSATPFGTSSTTPLQQWGNGVDGITTAAVTVNSTIAPDWRVGRELTVNVTGAGLTVTVSAPVPTPSTQNRGVQMLLRLYNNNGGVTTWATGAYHLATTVSTTAGDVTELTVQYDVIRGIWFEVSRAVHT